MEFFCKKELSFLYHLLIQSFIYVSMDFWVSISLFRNPVFCYWNGSCFGHWEQFQVGTMSFPPAGTLSISLHFGDYRIPQTHLASSLP